MSSQPKQKRRCPSCGSTNPANATSCDICGYVFGPSDAGSSKRAISFRPTPAQPVKPAQPKPPAPPPSESSPQPLSHSETPSSPPVASPATPAEPADEAHAAPAETTSPPPVVGEAPDAPTTERATPEEGHEPPVRRSFGVPSAAGAASTPKVEFKSKSQVAAYQPQPRFTPASKPAAPYKPKASTPKRPIAISTARSRSHSLLSLALILGTVLGVAALLAIAIAGSGAIRDSSARPVMPTPIIVTEPATDVLPAAAATATEAAPPVATATSEPSPSPLPTDTLPPPTETPAPQPTDTPAAQTNAVTYTVKQGDSCWAIATRFSISVDDLIRQNNLTANCLIRPGQELVIRR